MAQQSPAQPGLLRRLLGRSVATAEISSSAEQTAPNETWRRFALAPGVELHVREPVSAALRSRVEQMLVPLRKMLEEETQSTEHQA
jgi:hypothetical protein